MRIKGRRPRRCVISAGALLYLDGSPGVGWFGVVCAAQLLPCAKLFYCLHREADGSLEGSEFSPLGGGTRYVVFTVLRCLQGVSGVVFIFE